MKTSAPINRRPIRTRGALWARSLAASVARTGISPNTISGVGVLVALVGAAAVVWGGAIGWFAGAVAVQTRLLCNMLDGLVAVEHDRKSALGDLFNEVPDRMEDVLFLVAAGIASGTAWLGWLASLLAVGTAYIRLLGGSLGLDQDFKGPLAKPQRMFVLTVTFLLAGALELWGANFPVVKLGLSLIAVGTACTFCGRLGRMASRLREGS